MKPLPDQRGVDVSIIIVNWNTCDVLRGCLSSIFEQTTDISIEVIVIDNASCDGSVEAVSTEFPAVTLIANHENRGFAAANNQGIRISRGRHVLLLNPDTVILDAAITRCVAFADVRPDIGVVGCKVFTDEDTVQQTGFAFPGPWNLFLVLSGLGRCFPKSRIFGRPELGWWDRDSELDLDVVSGMFMLVRREAIEQVGLMDERFFVYAEEADWCYRFAKAGWRRVFTPTARILHLDGGGKSSSQINTRMFIQLQKSLLIYFRKHLGPVSWTVGKMLYIASDLGRSAAWLVSARVTGDPGLRAKSAAAAAALRYHLRGIEPT
ncbi:glycosyltransferase family 2 protein [Methylobacterium sp. C25]|uniref:glycosyltransferase family 2 protein n=1 Tax=Methylobacterium sp. C25 TaxID=2721622 RepID=UPI001F44A9B0|nr:glycosyltransferase family 2 protein [Methylobacterium sp. C25]MCE4225050.1 glycosyltransferase family 2 protein [Methylobacterium sp. C25]